MAQLPYWIAGVHHDGSELYVSNPLPEYGERVTVRLRVPSHAPITQVYLRTLPDGEGHYNPMEQTDSGDVSTWWQGTIPITMPVNPYRFKIFTADDAFHVNSLGTTRHEGMSLYDFKLLANYEAPLWTQDSVFYHIFVDRFHNGDPASDVPPGAWSEDGIPAQHREWDLPPLPWEAGRNLDFYGGDLPGIVQKLDYLRDLGVNTVYLTPIFVARSNHRYDTVDFENVDPYVGGNAALAQLREALDRSGMHLALDIVVNHLGSSHLWFKAAQASIDAPSAAYFTFVEHPHRYETWLGINTLVKLNYQSDSLRDAFYRAPDSILRRWMREPYRIDAWRFDVFHMMARQGRVRLEHEIGRDIRRALKGDNPAVYLYGEHSFDGTPHLQGDELDATMNYEGFSIPLRRWLTGFMGPEWPQAENSPSPLPGEAVVAQWRDHLAPVPWVIARQQYHMLSSHDMIRFLTLVQGDKALLRLGAALVMTFPGVPSIYYGDEIGMDGGADPENRKTFPWDESRWDKDLRDYFRTLVHLRRSAPALIRGGLQFLFAQESLIAYQRETAEQQLIIIAYRGPGMLAEEAVPVWHAGIRDGAVLTDLLSGERYRADEGSVWLHELPAGTTLILERL